jgi:glycosyltransferase involved in cell wall biosynthesis
MNRFLAKMPFFNFFCLTWMIVARPRPKVHPVTDTAAEPTVSVLIPTRNEKGNIEDAFTRTPKMGKWTELIFVDGNSDDGTVEEINRCIEKYGNQWQRAELFMQNGKGKGNAVRQGFDQCKGDILMILDSDLTMPPEELPKYYEAIVSGKGDFINGCRLVYPMETKAMRFLNMIANHFFARLFTWLLGQNIKDTLCGTKVLWRRDYERIAANRSYFGDFDPFGDFDLLFGASRLNHKIVDMPIRYRERCYGDIKINRWQHGLLLLRMSLIAFRKLKLY